MKRGGVVTEGGSTPSSPSGPAPFFPPLHPVSLTPTFQCVSKHMPINKLQYMTGPVVTLLSGWPSHSSTAMIHAHI